MSFILTAYCKKGFNHQLVPCKYNYYKQQTTDSTIKQNKKEPH